MRADLEDFPQGPFGEDQTGCPLLDQYAEAFTLEVIRGLVQFADGTEVEFSMFPDRAVDRVFKPGLHHGIDRGVS